MSDNYCIKPEYRSKAGNQTFDTDDREFWLPSRIATSALYQYAVYEWARELIYARDLKTVLDIGCGPATKLVKLLSPHADVFGIDQPSAVEYCKKNHEVGEFYSDNFESPALELDATFDLIICSDVIEHMDDPDVLLSYIRRFARPKTIVLISTPDRDRYRGKSCVESPKVEHVREWAADEFRQYLESRKFHVEESRHLAPVKTGLNWVTLMQLAYQCGHLRSYRYSFAALCGVVES